MEEGLGGGGFGDPPSFKSLLNIAFQLGTFIYKNPPAVMLFLFMCNIKVI